MKVIILKRKGMYDEEWDICGVFTTKEKIKEYKKWLKQTYPVLYEDAEWDEDVRELDKFQY